MISAPGPAVPKTANEFESKSRLIVYKNQYKNVGVVALKYYWRQSKRFSDNMLDCSSRKDYI